MLVSVLDGSEMWVANVGDCRGVMVSGVAEVTSLSYDHKPSQVSHGGPSRQSANRKTNSNFPFS